MYVFIINGKLLFNKSMDNHDAYFQAILMQVPKFFQQEVPLIATCACSVSSVEGSAQGVHCLALAIEQVKSEVAARTGGV
jgi:hypothetical protein